MSELALALAAFLLAHLLPAVRPLRQRLVRRLGNRLYLSLYSLLSLALIFWIFVAYRDAPYRELWAASAATAWVPLAMMPVACFLLVAGLSSANPFSLSLGGGPFDPERPGIVGLCRHPALWGFLIWAVSHMVANGDVASLLLFGLLALLSAGGPVLLDRKRQAALGTGPWHRLHAQVRATGCWTALLQVGPWRLLAAGLLYLALLYAHGPVIGVSPLAAVQI